MMRAFDLSGKVAVVTGVCGLLGSRFATVLDDSGAFPVYGIDATNGVDIADPQRVAEWFSDVPRLDILVNAAAVNPQPADCRTPFEDYPLDAWRRTIDVNLTGTMLCCQAAGRIMLKQGSGVIVNIASTYGIVAPDQRVYSDGYNKPADYGVSKAGVIQLSRDLACRWGSRGVRVNCLSPGGVENGQDADFVQRYAERVPMMRMARHDELNAALLFLCSEASSYMNGHNLVVDGGWTAW